MFSRAGFLVRRRATRKAQALAMALSARLAPGRTRPDNAFNFAHVQWLDPVPSGVADRYVEAIPEPRQVPWHLPDAEGAAISAQALRCKTESGVWPISFSYPRRTLRDPASRIEFISRILPGTAYSFDDAREYEEAYRRAHYAITHRKAGWDCFRHVEIMAAGSIPLMLDAIKIPNNCMIHYPKKMMQQVVTHLALSGDVPSDELRDTFRDHFDEHLTTRSMARYILNCSQLDRAERVLFVDRSLPLTPDYLSVLTLIGLKQQLGTQCDVMFPVDYIYEDWRGLDSDLYGRGFGYARCITPEARSKHERFAAKFSIERAIKRAAFDAIIIGSIARNSPLAHRLLQEFPSSRTVWIHGEDAPPSPYESYILRNSETQVFVRHPG